MIVFKTKKQEFGCATTYEFQEFLKKRGELRRFVLVDKDGKKIRDKYGFGFQDKPSVYFDEIEDWHNIGIPEEWLGNHLPIFWENVFGRQK